MLLQAVSSQTLVLTISHVMEIKHVKRMKKEFSNVLILVPLQSVATMHAVELLTVSHSVNVNLAIMVTLMILPLVVFKGIVLLMKIAPVISYVTDNVTNASVSTFLIYCSLALFVIY